MWLVLSFITGHGMQCGHNTSCIWLTHLVNKYRRFTCLLPHISLIKHGPPSQSHFVSSLISLTGDVGIQLERLNTVYFPILGPWSSWWPLLDANVITFQQVWAKSLPPTIVRDVKWHLHLTFLPIKPSYLPYKCYTFCQAVDRAVKRACLYICLTITCILPMCSCDITTSQVTIRAIFSTLPCDGQSQHFSITSQDMFSLLICVTAHIWKTDLHTKNLLVGCATFQAWKVSFGFSSLKKKKKRFSF